MSTTSLPSMTTTPTADGGLTATCSCGWTTPQTEYGYVRRAAATHTASHRRARALIEDVEWLIECHVGLTEAARRLGYRNGNGLERYLLRHDRADLANTLRARDWDPMEPSRHQRWAA